jgi:hypothetical protein
MKVGTYDITGRTIHKVIVSSPDRPVSMSDQSVSDCYLTLDDGITVRVDVDEYIITPETIIQKIKRDTGIEAEFAKAIGARITGIAEEGIHLQGGMIISIALGQFWIRPTLDRNEN